MAWPEVRSALVKDRPAARRLSTVLPALSLLMLPVAAVAQIYVCKDASGRTITADRPIAECANRSMRELDRNGVTRREIPPPLTPQQRREHEALEEKRRVEAAAVEEQRLYDRALTTRYRNEADIAVARQRAIELLDDQMRIDTGALAGEMKEMKSAQAAVVASTKKGGTVVERRRLADASHTVEGRLSSIEQRTAEIEREHQKFDRVLKRFREIQAANEATATRSAARER
jgi:hypothetical protein